MTIIFGESSSGKSLLSLKMIKNITGVIYLSLDCDKSIESKLKNSNIKFLPVQYWPNMLDIEREIIIQNRNYKTTHIIIDPINYIKYKSLSPIDGIKKLLSDFKSLEYKYEIKVIVVFNTLINIDETNSTILDCIKRQGFNMIETVKRNRFRL